MKTTIKYYLLGLTICFCNLTLFAQNKNIDSLLTLLKNDKPDTNKVIHSYKLCSEYMRIGEYDNALHFGNVALQLAQKLNFKKGVSKSYNSIGNVYYRQGNYPEALKNHFTSLKLKEAIGDKAGIADSYNNIGNVYYNQGNYPDALKNHFASLQLQEAIGDKKGIATSYNNIGNVYCKQCNYPDALKNYFASLQVKEAIGDKAGIANSYSNIGSVYFSRAELLQSPDSAAGREQLFNDALNNDFASLQLREAIGDKDGIASSYINIGAVYTKQKKFKEAREYLMKAKKISIETGSKERIKNSYSGLSVVDSATGNYKSEIINYKLFILYRDSLDNDQTKKKTIQSTMQYEFDKKEIASRAEQDKKDAVQQSEAKREKVIRYSVIAGLMLMFIVSFVIFRSLSITRKQKQIIEVTSKETEDQKKVIEEKNKDITDSITYAKRIQRAMLPHRRDIWAAFPQSFVLFKPKDIVSGDFYFFHNNNQSAFIATADCTGHGVPGAFMSMIGEGKLNDAVSQSADTSAILSLLNKGIKTALKQTDGDKSTRDGMDIALCSIDTENRIVKYAGANRPLWIIRNGTTEVEEIKATKTAIGGLTEDTQHFDTHKLKLQRGDTFYICTDGLSRPEIGLQ